MSGFNIFQNPPIGLNLWWYVKNMDAYRAQQQGHGHPLQLFIARIVRKEEKPHGENTPSIKEKAQFLNDMYSIGIYIHLNELNELKQDEILDEEIMNSMIMR